MKCCGCDKNLNLNIGMFEGKSLWFKKTIGQWDVKVICVECIQDPDKKDKYKK